MTNPPFAPDNPRTRQASFRKCSAWYGSIEDNCVGSPAAVAGFAARTSVTLFTTATVVGAFPFVQDRRLLVLDLAVDPRRRGCSMLCPPLLLCQELVGFLHAPNCMLQLLRTHPGGIGSKSWIGPLSTWARGRVESV